MRGVTRTILLIAALGSLVACASRPGDDRILASVRDLDVHSLDPKLPNERFDIWIAANIPHDAQVEWSVNDCETFEGSGAYKRSELPTCVEVTASLPDGREISIAVPVGFDGRKPTPDNQLFWMSVVREFKILADSLVLSDLPRLLAETADGK